MFFTVVAGVLFAIFLYRVYLYLEQKSLTPLLWYGLLGMFLVTVLMGTYLYVFYWYDRTGEYLVAPQILLFPVAGVGYAIYLLVKETVSGRFKKK